MSPPSDQPRRPVSSSPNWFVVAIVVGVVLYSLIGPKLFQRKTAPGPASPQAESKARETIPNPPLIQGTPLSDDESPPPKTGSSTTKVSSPPAAGEPAGMKPAAQGERWQLKETSPGVFTSPAGLIYKRGGAQGHRLDHVLEHAHDDKSKPVHGVFNSERDEILSLIDDAWNLAQTRGPPTVQKEREGDRTVYTVDMQRKLGYEGGRTGAKKNHPPLTGIRLVVEDHDVITAFPVKP